MNSRVASIDGQEKAESVTLEGGGSIPADMVLVSIGAIPSIDLAKKAGLRITDRGSIWVDDYMRTDAEEIFAVGDCALKRDFFTRKEVPVWLASTATAEARNAEPLRHQGLAPDTGDNQRLFHEDRRRLLCKHGDDLSNVP